MHEKTATQFTTKHNNLEKVPRGKGTVEPPSPTSSFLTMALEPPSSLTFISEPLTVKPQKNNVNSSERDAWMNTTLRGTLAATHLEGNETQKTTHKVIHPPYGQRKIEPPEHNYH